MISVTLPSLRPAALARTLENIERTRTSDVEVVVVSPFDPGPRAVWVAEGEPRGIAAAHAAGFVAVTGEFVVPFADDHEFLPGWDAVAVANFTAREYNDRENSNLFSLGLRGAHSGHVGTEFGIYYPYFPMMRRSAVAAVGGWLDGAFVAGFADSDLALRVWSTGGRCEWSVQGLLRPLPDDARKRDADDGARRPAANYTQGDLDLFISRWAPVYGSGWPVARLSDFCIDLDPAHNTPLVEDNSIFCNYPAFASAANRMVGS